MHGKYAALVLISTLSGFLGGAIVSSSVYGEPPVHPTAVRATGFELIDESGKVLATLRRGSDGTAALGFRRGDSQESVQIGVSRDGSPFLAMYGPDSTVRLKLYLFDGERPLLAMNEREYEGRVLLGMTSHKGEEDVWGLRFGARGNRPFVDLGVFTLKGEDKGFSIVRNADGKVLWSAPQK